MALTPQEEDLVLTTSFWHESLYGKGNDDSNAPIMMDDL